jgi:hypothetical protein
LREIRREFYAIQRPLVTHWDWIPSNIHYENNGPGARSGWVLTGQQWIPTLRGGVWTLIRSHDCNELITALLPLTEDPKWRVDVAIVLDHGDQMALQQSAYAPNEIWLSEPRNADDTETPPRPAEYEVRPHAQLGAANSCTTFDDSMEFTSGHIPKTAPAFPDQVDPSSLEGQMQYIAMMMQYAWRRTQALDVVESRQLVMRLGRDNVLATLYPQLVKNSSDPNLATFSAIALDDERVFPSKLYFQNPQDQDIWSDRVGTEGLDRLRQAVRDAILAADK